MLKNPLFESEMDILENFIPRIHPDNPILYARIERYCVKFIVLGNESIEIICFSRFFNHSVESAVRNLVDGKIKKLGVMTEEKEDEIEEEVSNSEQVDKKLDENDEIKHEDNGKVKEIENKHEHDQEKDEDKDKEKLPKYPRARQSIATKISRNAKFIIPFGFTTLLLTRLRPDDDEDETNSFNPEDMVDTIYRGGTVLNEEFNDGAKEEALSPVYMNFPLSASRLREIEEEERRNRLRESIKSNNTLDLFNEIIKKEKRNSFNNQIKDSKLKNSILIKLFDILLTSVKVFPDRYIFSTTHLLYTPLSNLYTSVNLLPDLSLAEAQKYKTLARKLGGFKYVLITGEEWKIEFWETEQSPNYLEIQVDLPEPYGKQSLVLTPSILKKFFRYQFINFYGNEKMFIDDKRQETDNYVLTSETIYNDMAVDHDVGKKFYNKGNGSSNIFLISLAEDLIFDKEYLRLRLKSLEIDAIQDHLDNSIKKYTKTNENSSSAVITNSPSNNNNIEEDSFEFNSDGFDEDSSILEDDENFKKSESELSLDLKMNYVLNFNKNEISLNNLLLSDAYSPMKNNNNGSVDYDNISSHVSSYTSSYLEDIEVAGGRIDDRDCVTWSVVKEEETEEDYFYNKVEEIINGEKSIEHYKFANSIQSFGKLTTENIIQPNKDSSDELSIDLNIIKSINLSSLNNAQKNFLEAAVIQAKEIRKKFRELALNKIMLSNKLSIRLLLREQLEGKPFENVDKEFHILKATNDIINDGINNKSEFKDQFLKNEIEVLHTQVKIKRIHEKNQRLNEMKKNNPLLNALQSLNYDKDPTMATYLTDNSVNPFDPSFTTNSLETINNIVRSLTYDEKLHFYQTTLPPRSLKYRFISKLFQLRLNLLINNTKDNISKDKFNFSSQSRSQVSISTIKSFLTKGSNLSYYLTECSHKDIQVIISNLSLVDLPLNLVSENTLRVIDRGESDWFKQKDVLETSEKFKINRNLSDENNELKESTNINNYTLSNNLETVNSLLGIKKGEVISHIYIVLTGIVSVTVNSYNDSYRKEIIEKADSSKRNEQTDYYLLHDDVVIESKLYNAYDSDDEKDLELIEEISSSSSAAQFVTEEDENEKFLSLLNNDEIYSPKSPPNLPTILKVLRQRKLNDIKFEKLYKKRKKLIREKFLRESQNNTEENAANQENIFINNETITRYYFPGDIIGEEALLSGSTTWDIDINSFHPLELFETPSYLRELSKYKLYNESPKKFNTGIAPPVSLIKIPIDIVHKYIGRPDINLLNHFLSITDSKFLPDNSQITSPVTSTIRSNYMLDASEISDIVKVPYQLIQKNKECSHDIINQMLFFWKYTRLIVIINRHNIALQQQIKLKNLNKPIEYRKESSSFLPENSYNAEKSNASVHSTLNSSVKNTKDEVKMTEDDDDVPFLPYLDVFSTVRLRSYSPGSFIFTQGDPRNYLYIIKMGSASYFRDVENHLPSHHTIMELTTPTYQSISHEDIFNDHQTANQNNKANLNDLIIQDKARKVQNLLILLERKKRERSRKKQPLRIPLISGRQLLPNDCSFLDGEFPDKFINEIREKDHQFLQARQAALISIFQEENYMIDLNKNDDIFFHDEDKPPKFQFNTSTPTTSSYPQLYSRFGFHQNSLVATTKCEVLVLKISEIAKSFQLFYNLFLFCSNKYNYLHQSYDYIVSQWILDQVWLNERIKVMKQLKIETAERHFVESKSPLKGRQRKKKKDEEDLTEFNAINLFNSNTTTLACDENGIIGGTQSINDQILDIDHIIQAKKNLPSIKVNTNNKKYSIFSNPKSNSSFFDNEESTSSMIRRLSLSTNTTKPAYTSPMRTFSPPESPTILFSPTSTFSSPDRQSIYNYLLSNEDEKVVLKNSPKNKYPIQPESPTNTIKTPTNNEYLALPIDKLFELPLPIKDKYGKVKKTEASNFIETKTNKEMLTPRKVITLSKDGKEEKKLDFYLEYSAKFESIITENIIKDEDLDLVLRENEIYPLSFNYNKQNIDANKAYRKSKIPNYMTEKTNRRSSNATMSNDTLSSTESSTSISSSYSVPVKPNFPSPSKVSPRKQMY